jgi:hypothetical protein
MNQQITDLSQCSIMAEESGTGGPVTHPQDVSHTNASAEGLNAAILKAPTDAPSEHFEGHNGVRTTTDIKEEVIMANVQHNSFFQEGADDGHWADRRVFPPRSEADGRPEVANAICLGEGRWH